MNKAPGFAAPPPNIATKAELDQLIETRPAPSVQVHLTPNGPETAQVNTQLAMAQEYRIAELNERLKNMREGAGRDHAFARLQGHARVDFERSR